MATNDTKVHTWDAELPPISDATEKSKVLRSLSGGIV
jgi:hypothetical protein